MTDIIFPEAGVVPVGEVEIEVVTAGATQCDEGMPVYKNAADGGRVAPCDADTLDTSICAGIAATTSIAAGQKLVIYKSGSLNYGSVLTAGGTYCVSTTAGRIAPEADLTTGDYKTIIGVATSATTLKLGINNSRTALG